MSFTGTNNENTAESLRLSDADVGGSMSGSSSNKCSYGVTARQITQDKMQNQKSMDSSSSLPSVESTSPSLDTDLGSLALNSRLKAVDILRQSSPRDSVTSGNVETIPKYEHTLTSDFEIKDSNNSNLGPKYAKDMLQFVVESPKLVLARHEFPVSFDRSDSTDSTNHGGLLNSNRSSITDGSRRTRMRASDINKSESCDTSPMDSPYQPADPQYFKFQRTPLSEPIKTKISQEMNMQRSERDEVSLLKGEIEKLNQDVLILKQALSLAVNHIPVDDSSVPVSKSGSPSILVSMSPQEQAVCHFLTLATTSISPNAATPVLETTSDFDLPLNNFGAALVPARSVFGSSKVSLHQQPLLSNSSPPNSVVSAKNTNNSVNDTSAESAQLQTDLPSDGVTQTLVPVSLTQTVQRSPSLVSRMRDRATQILSDLTKSSETKPGIGQPSIMTRTPSHRRASMPSFATSGTKQLKGILKQETNIQSVADVNAKVHPSQESDEMLEHPQKPETSKKRISWIKTIISDVKLDE
ncbi:hypothetical protein BCR33DRAFT_716983 [Rhizoclosmatium globosum]|uniref:Uncharacterized protein n=1 Tax=Rhizoclosmatium globosum TaxID=329046 RepID=A0A1Y2CBR5_9FUNG|nr:hypothetical protein BCR33DRAFT_716983 [Rhizoclosmatium globosum]|eukprot:ORY44472.1 hypothetical protein BCR33DRAFT_716983 [Rhizoclosmatium globosum]